MPLELTDINDLIVTTDATKMRDRYVSLAATLQRYVAARQLLDKRKKECPGYSWEWRVQVAPGQTAQFVGPFATDNVNRVDEMATASVEMQRLTFNYLIDETEILMNAHRPERIIDLTNELEVGAHVDAYNKIEDNFWAQSPLNADNTPIGIFGYIVTEGATSTVALNGLNHSNFSSGVGLNSTTYPDRWANWNVLYTEVTQEDAVKKMREVAEQANFMPPYSYPALENAPDLEVYVGLAEWLKLMDLARAQNQSIGPDIAYYDGRAVFLGAPITRVPRIDGHTNNPIVLCNWQDGQFLYHPALFFRRKEPRELDLKHTSYAVYFDLMYQLVFTNRRTQGVLVTA